MRKDKVLEITLQSDLCTGSGYAFSGMIDSDVCFDANGIPYIPSRRIKGCMREAAITIMEHPDISMEIVENLFGVRGNQEAAGLRLEDARPEGYRKLTDSISKLKKDPNIAAFIQPQKVLGAFTSVRAQTKMENGSAKDNTLRYTRVINQYRFSECGSTAERMRFLAECSFMDDNEGRMEKAMECIVKAFRSLGLNRNRGLGSIRCRFIPKTDQTQDCGYPDMKEGTSVIFYRIRNEEPLMISGNDENESYSFIPGQMMLGALAAEYLSGQGNSANSQEFINLFLDGKVSYSNLYIYKDGKAFVPAPSFVARLKKTKAYVNVLAKDDAESDEIYNTSGGNMPKRLKDTYLNLDESGSVSTCEAEQQIIYHHRREHADGLEEILYSHQVLKEGQHFWGKIQGPKDLLEKIADMMRGMQIRLGKSKTAQYGRCVLEAWETETEFKRKASYKAGDIILAALESDMILSGSSGAGTAFYPEVYRTAAEELGIWDKIDQNAQYGGTLKPDLPVRSILSVRYIHGYHTQWNLRKAPVPAIAVGSVLAFRLVKDAEVCCHAIGERTHEGYGQIRLYRMEDFPYRLRVAQLDCSVADNLAQTKADIYDKLAVQILRENARASLQDTITMYMKTFPLKISASTLGRVTLMLREAGNSFSDTNDRFTDFMRRVESIKRKAEKEEICKIIHAFMASKTSVGWILDVKKLLKFASSDSYMKSHGDDFQEGTAAWKILGWVSQDKAEEEIKSLWFPVLTAVLTNQKYMKKLGG